MRHATNFQRFFWKKFRTAQILLSPPHLVYRQTRQANLRKGSEFLINPLSSRRPWAYRAKDNPLED